MEGAVGGHADDDDILLHDVIYGDDELLHNVLDEVERRSASLIQRLAEQGGRLPDPSSVGSPQRLKAIASAAEPELGGGSGPNTPPSAAHAYSEEEVTSLKQALEQEKAICRKQQARLTVLERYHGCADGAMRNLLARTSHESCVQLIDDSQAPRVHRADAAAQSIAWIGRCERALLAFIDDMRSERTAAALRDEELRARLREARTSANASLSTAVSRAERAEGRNHQLIAAMRGSIREAVDAACEVEQGRAAGGTPHAQSGGVVSGGTIDRAPARPHRRERCVQAAEAAWRRIDAVQTSQVARQAVRSALTLPTMSAHFVAGLHSR